MGAAGAGEAAHLFAAAAHPFRPFPASAFATRGAHASRDAFRAWWRDSVLRLAMLSHQYKNGAASRGKVEEVVHAMGAHLCGALLSAPWAVGLMLDNVERGEAADPPPGWWGRVVKCMALGSDAVRARRGVRRGGARRGACARGLPAQTAGGGMGHAARRACAAERAALLARAPEAARSLELRGALCARLDAANGAYLCDAVSLCLLMHAAALTTEQLAEVYLASWPHLPSGSGLLAAVAALWAPPRA